jgi:putative heme-binding domain-containing protein
MLLQKAFMNWRQYSKATRGRLIAIAARSPTFAPVLLDALDNGKVAPIEIDASARQSFRRIPDESAKRRVETLLSDASSADRQQIVNQFAPAAQIAGDPQRGSAIFERACLVCHAVAGKGNHVGPDLSSISSRSKETLLVDILDPSRTVSPDYVNYILTTTTGEVFSGVIAAESSAAVTMRRPSEADQTVPRNLIKSLRADGKSVMPDGLEQGLSRPDMADLLEFLVHPTIPRD